MLEFEVKHKRGRKTFLYTLVIHNWLWILIGAGFVYLSWLTYFGNLREITENFLTQNSQWYITVGMLSQWILLIGISVLAIAVLRAHVLYSYYKFILDEYAVHLHKGLFFIRETTIPYAQISNVHIMRPYHYRLLGISQLDVVTAADKGLEGVETRTKKFFIPIIDTRLARILSRQLLECAERSRKGLRIYDEDDDALNDSGDDENDSEDEDAEQTDEE